MPSLLPRSHADDSELAVRVGSGDGAAFATLDARYRGVLTRYAGSLLRRSEHDAEDVVQDVLIRAHEALRRGEGPDELRPWLYRLTRNRAIDHVRLKRWGDESLDPERAFAGGGREDPESVLRQKEAMRRLVEDLADLPVRQREVLLARELDDQSPEDVAAQLGLSVAAARNLAIRARENLIKTRDARDADCREIRVMLLDAHERGVRPSEHGVRHVKSCDACRAHQRDLRRLSRRLHALNPAVGLPLLAGVAQLFGGGGAKAAAGVAAVVAAAATGGIVVLKSEVHAPGDPSPFQLIGGIRDSEGRRVTRGTPIPEGVTVVTMRVRVPAGPSTEHKDANGKYPGITLPCPQGMKYAGLQFPNRRLPAYADPEGSPIPGHATGIRMRITHPGLTRAEVFTVAIDCRRPDKYGSIFRVRPAFERAVGRDARRLAHVCPTRYHALTRVRPGGARADFGEIYGGWPVAIVARNAAGTWTRVVAAPDGSQKGWLRTAWLCP